MDNPRVTLVHERFTTYAGSESLVEQLATEWPEAAIVAPIARPGVLPRHMEDRLTTTRLSSLLRGEKYAHLLPLLPLAAARLKLPPSDVVIATHHAYISQVVNATDVPVVGYINSPARWVWDPAMRRGEAGGWLGNAALAAFSAAFRPADLAAARKLTTVVSNSSAVATRVREWWGRESVVIHPPVNTEYYTPDPEVPREDFFLVAGRLVPYKRPDLAVMAAAKAGVPLVVAGEGRARQQIEALAGPGTRFLGRVSDEELRSLFRRCRAFLMPGVEDFGIVPVEAMACGAPVLAVEAGGAVDYVIEGVSGHRVPVAPDAQEEVDLWASALSTFDDRRYVTAEVRATAEGFSRATFRSRMADVVATTLGGSRAQSA